MRDLRQLPADRVLVSPSLLAADFNDLAGEIAAVTAAGADALHLDVMDGHLVPNISFGVPVIASLRKRSELLFDTHLMISEPARYASVFAKAGADHLTFHIEAEGDTRETIAAIRKTGCTVGISLRPGTAAEAIFPYLDAIDLVLVMTVEPGFGGQAFMTEQLEKIRTLRAAGFKGEIAVDGGVNLQNARDVCQAGGNVLVMGTKYFQAEDPAAVARAVRELS